MASVTICTSTWCLSNAGLIQLHCPQYWPPFTSALASFSFLLGNKLEHWWQNRPIVPGRVTLILTIIKKLVARSILVQITIYRRFWIGRDGHLEQSETYDIWQHVRECGPLSFHGLEMRTAVAIVTSRWMEICCFCVITQLHGYHHEAEGRLWTSKIILIENVPCEYLNTMWEAKGLKAVIQS